MLACEGNFGPSRVLGNNQPSELVHLRVYMIKNSDRKCRSWIWGFELKDIIKSLKVDQQSQVLIRFSTLKGSKPEGVEFGIRVELRKVRVEVL